MTRPNHDKGESCACVATHRPVPLELAVHRILPGEYGGKYEAGNTVWLCPTTHVNVHELFRLIRSCDGDLSFYQATQISERVVSRYAFALAQEGWRRVKEVTG